MAKTVELETTGDEPWITIRDTTITDPTRNYVLLDESEAYGIARDLIKALAKIDRGAVVRHVFGQDPTKFVLKFRGESMYITPKV